ncbi:hypothetical protein AGMMS4956_00750 [Bacteroidia bacterium]|nr:hypothetical protein AGMMS4956_00750 [Bacteroidia bacterium]
MYLVRRTKVDKYKPIVVRYLKSIPQKERSAEQQQVLDYLKWHSISSFPYAFKKKYKLKNITVYADSDKGMYYVLQDGKRLYFKQSMDKETARAYAGGILCEQDENSPHRYETADFHVEHGDVVADAGAAEGNFGLAVVERVKKLFLFEPEADWIAPLEATFAPWKDKVFIVNRCISSSYGGGG